MMENQYVDDVDSDDIYDDGNTLDYSAYHQTVADELMEDDDDDDDNDGNDGDKHCDKNDQDGSCTYHSTREKHCTTINLDQLAHRNSAVLSAPYEELEFTTNKHVEVKHNGKVTSSNRTKKSEKEFNCSEKRVRFADQERIPDAKEIDEMNNDELDSSDDELAPTKNQPSNDELLYDPNLDDENELWVKELRARATQSEVAQTRNRSDGLVAEPESDAV